MSCCKRKQKTRQEICKRNRSGSIDWTSTRSNGELLPQIQSSSNMFLSESNSKSECSQIDERECKRQEAIQLAGEELALIYHPFMEGDLPSWFKTHRNRSNRRKRRTRSGNRSRRRVSRPFEWKPYPHRNQDQLYNQSPQMHIQIHEPSIPRSYRFTETSTFPTTLTHIRPLSTNESRSQSNRMSIDESRCVWNRSRRIAQRIDPTSNPNDESNLSQINEEDDDEWGLSRGCSWLTIQPLLATTHMNTYHRSGLHTCFQFHSFAGITYVRRTISRISDEEDDQFGIVEALLREHRFTFQEQHNFYKPNLRKVSYHDYWYEFAGSHRAMFKHCCCQQCYINRTEKYCLHSTPLYTYDATGNIIIKDVDADGLNFDYSQHYRFLLGNALMLELE